MVKQKIKAAAGWVEDSLRDLCSSLSPDGRIIVTLSMFLILTVLSLYFSISSIYHFGKGSGEKMQIRHVGQLRLELEETQTLLDSTKQINLFNHERE